MSYTYQAGFIGAGNMGGALGCDPIRNRIGEGYLMGGEDA